MIKSIRQWIFQLKIEFFAVLMALMAVTCLFFFEGPYKIFKNLSSVKIGIGTCFKRTTQSFMAVGLNSSNINYLNFEFLALTQECYDELTRVYDEKLPQFNSISRGHLKELVSESHWFNQDLQSRKMYSLKDFKQLILKRFERIELVKERLLEVLKTDLNRQDLKMGRFKVLLFVLLMGIFGLTLIIFYERKKKNKANSYYNKEAEQIINGKCFLSAMAFEEFFKEILEQNNLHNCSFLFSDNFKKITFNSRSWNNKLSVREEEKVMEKNLEISSHYTKGEIIKLEDTVDKVLDYLSKSLFSRAIRVDVKLSEQSLVIGNEEILQQIVYHLFNMSVISFSDSKENNLIKLRGVVNKDILELSLEDNSKQILSSELKKNDEFQLEFTELGIGRAILRELMKELGGQINFSSVLDEHQKVLGHKISALFPRPLDSTSSKKLNKVVRRVVRGTKKELTQEISK